MKKWIVMFMLAAGSVQAAGVDIDNLYESMETLNATTNECNQELQVDGIANSPGPACVRFNRNWHVLQEIYDFIKKRQPEDLTVMLKEQYGDDKTDKFWAMLQETQNGLLQLQEMNYSVN